MLVKEKPPVKNKHYANKEEKKSAADFNFTVQLQEKEEFFGLAVRSDSR